MDFVDATLVRLADPASRAAVLDEVALAQLIAASRDIDGLDVAAPYAAVFDTLRFFYSDDRGVAFSGAWMTVGHTDRSELSVQAAGLGVPGPRIDALWTGAITATARPADSHVDQVTLAYADVGGLDAEIIPLPTDPTQLEVQRRAHLLARIRAKLDQPNLFDDAALGAWLVKLDVTSVSELMAGPQTAAGASIRVHYTSPADVAPLAQTFHVAVAFLVRSMPISIAELLDETRRIRPYLDQLGFALPRLSDPRARRTPLVAWVVPGELFDDTGWPGATASAQAAAARASRRAWAGSWLASEGIGLIVPPTN
jgi:hypothetical protein